MKVYGLSVVGSVSKQTSTSEPKEDAALHSHDNIHVLARLTSDENGRLLFDGQPIEGGGLDLSNAEDLQRLAIDENGQLTIDGVVVSGGSGSSAPMSVTKLGSGTALVKSVIGSDIQTRSLVAGTNVTLDVSGDEVKINASLSGSVSASTTLTKSDDFTRSAQVISLSYATKLRAIEPSISDSGLVFQATLCDDTNASINGGALSSKGTASTLVETSLFRNERALKCSGGCLVVPEGTTASVTAPSTWFSGTKDWCIELEFARDTSKLGTTQNLASNYTDNYANASLWIGIGTDNCLYVGIGYGTTVAQSLSIRSSVAVTDGSKHHIAVVRQGSTYTLYVDGVSRGTATSSSSNNAPTYGFYLGSSVSSGSPATQFYGYLRNVRIWNFAKYTAGFTLPAISYPTSGDSYLTMAGKLLSASFWKQVSSMSVVSIETATAYLKWLMVDVNGYWVWDSVNSVWVAADVENITSVGMTTAEVKAAFTNNQWNYRSDSVGFAVAFVTTDGTSTPVLNSITLAAVQSADKTSGHTVLNAQGATFPQRSTLKFVGMNVTDDGQTTTVKGATLSSDLLHAGSSLESVVDALQQNSGRIKTTEVDMTGLVDGATLVYDLLANSFKVAVPAIGASGQGIFKTNVFTLEVGQEIVVTHQLVHDGRAMYQIDQVVAGEASTIKNHFAFGFDVAYEGLAVAVVSPYDCWDPIRLPFTYGSMSKGAATTFPIQTCLGLSYVVDDTVYVMPLVSTNWAQVSTIYSAPISTPTTFTACPISVPVNFNSANGYRVHKYRGALYIFGSAASSGIWRASLDAPTVWEQVGYLPAPVCAGFAFIIGTKVYVGCGQIGGVATPKNAIYSADMSNLSAWKTEANVFPVAIGRLACYQYGSYLYVVGGETVYDSVYSNVVYRAHVDTPTVWQAFSTLPVTIGSIDDLVVYGGRVFIFGGRQNGATYLTSVYHADANNPSAWSTGTALSTSRQFSTKYVVDDQCYVVGGFNGTWLHQIEVYNFTPVSSIGQGVMTLGRISLSLIQSITDLNVWAKIPAQTSVTAAVSFDEEQTWSYYSIATSSWVQAESKAQALAEGAALTLVGGNKYKVTGLTGRAVESTPSITLALQLTSASPNTSPIVYYASLICVGAETYGPLLIGSYASTTAEICVKHATGSYSKTTIKNNKVQPINILMKVCDGAVA